MASDNFRPGSTGARIRFACPACGAKLQANAPRAGDVFPPCPKCGEILEWPAPGPVLPQPAERAKDPRPRCSKCDEACADLALVAGEQMCADCIDGFGDDIYTTLAGELAWWPSCHHCDGDVEAGGQGLPEDHGLCESHAREAGQVDLLESIEELLRDAGLEQTGCSSRSEASYWAHPDWPASDKCRVRLARHDAVHASSLECVGIVIAAQPPFESHVWVKPDGSAAVSRERRLVEVTLAEAVAHAIGLAARRAAKEET